MKKEITFNEKKHKKKSNIIIVSILLPILITSILFGYLYYSYTKEIFKLKKELNESYNEVTINLKRTNKNLINLKKEINQSKEIIDQKINNFLNKINEKIKKIETDEKNINAKILIINKSLVNEIMNLKKKTNYRIETLNKSLQNLIENIKIINDQYLLNKEILLLYELLDIASQNYYTYNFDKAANYYNLTINISENIKKEILNQKKIIENSNFTLKESYLNQIEILYNITTLIEQAAKIGKNLNEKYFYLNDNERNKLIVQYNNIIEKIENFFKTKKSLTNLKKVDLNKDTDHDGLKDWYELKIRSNPYQGSNEYTYLNEEIIKTALSYNERKKVSFLLTQIGIDENDNILDKAWKIEKWVDKNLEYDNEKLINYTSINYPYTTYLKRKGVCTDYAIFIGALLLDTNITPIYFFEIRYLNKNYGHAAVAIKYNGEYYILDQKLPIFSLENYYWYNLAIGNEINKIKIIEVSINKNKEIIINNTYTLNLKEISSKFKTKQNTIFKEFNEILKDTIEKYYNLSESDFVYPFAIISGYYKYYNTQYTQEFKKQFIKYVFPKPVLKKYEIYFKKANKYTLDTKQTCTTLTDQFQITRQICTFYYNISLGI